MTDSTACPWHGLAVENGCYSCIRAFNARFGRSVATAGLQPADILLADVIAERDRYAAKVVELEARLERVREATREWRARVGPP